MVAFATYRRKKRTGATRFFVLFEVFEPTSFETNEEKRDINTVKTYTEVLDLGGTQQNDEKNTVKQDNAKNSMKQFVNRVFEYMENNKLQKVTIDF